MICSISGEACTEPVVSVKSGYVFEKRIIMKHLENDAKDPFTQEPLSADDLLAVKAPKSLKPKTLTATSIPSLLQVFQNEWDAVMLETFTLKSQLDKVKQELAHALYQHDAACRVIARLIKERDEARNALASAAHAPAVRHQEVSEMEVEPPAAAGLPGDVVDQIMAKSQELSKSRKGRKPSPTLASAEDVKGYDVVASNPVHKSTPPGIFALDIHPKQDQIVSGGADSNVVIYTISANKVESTLTGHTKKITSVAWHPSQPALFSTSEDKTARVWYQEKNGSWSTMHTISAHQEAVTGCSVHATGDFIATGALDGWAFTEINAGQTLIKHPERGITSVQFHPDGLLLAAGTSDSLVKVWDLKSQKNAATFEGHTGRVVDVSFSENGFYLATAAADNLVKLWDLRKLVNFHTIELPSNFGLSTLDWDYSGSYLLVGGADIRVYFGKTANHVATFTKHSSTVTDVKWGQDAKWFASASLDRQLKVWGKRS